MQFRLKEKIFAAFHCKIARAELRCVHTPSNALGRDSNTLRVNAWWSCIHEQAHTTGV